MKLIPIISVLAFFAIALLILMLFLYFKVWKKKQMMRQWNETVKDIPEGAFQKARNTINRVDIIARANSHYLDTYNQLSLIYDDLVREFAAIDALKENVAFLFQQKKSDFIKIKTSLFQLDEHNRGANKMFDTFFKKARQITHQDEFMRNEFAFYQKNLRIVLKAYQEKQIYLQQINDPIANLTKQIRDLEKQYELIIQGADIKGSKQILSKYATKVLLFVDVINEGPAINAALNIQIPKTANNLNIFYNAQQDNLNASLEHINFLKTMKEINHEIIKAKKAFQNLNLIKVKAKIKKIFRDFKNLEGLINFEIKARNLFIKNYEPLLAEIKKLLIAFEASEIQYDNFSYDQKALIEDLTSQRQKLINLHLQLNKQGIMLRQTMLNNLKPFSMKLKIAKQTAFLAQDFAQKYNDFASLIWKIDLKKMQVKNKFLRADAALNQIVADHKKYNIQLIASQKSEFKRLLNNRLKIFQALNGQKGLNKNLVNAIENFELQFISFYKIISGEIQMALHSKNMFEEMSSYRAINSQINFDLQVAERNYLNGKYDLALAGIINSIQKRKK